jgi:hypothetical protein
MIDLLQHTPAFHFQHVKSHQSSDKSPESSYNNRCDELATSARALPTPSCSIQHVARRATLILNDTEVSSNEGDALRAAYSSQDLRQYYLMKNSHWTSQVIDDVDWFVKGKALGRLVGRSQKTILQYIHNWIPVNASPGAAKLGTARLCPFCQSTDETSDHLLSCTNVSARNHRLQSCDRLRQQLHRMRTPLSLNRSFFMQSFQIIVACQLHRMQSSTG